jgi:hypothetical protein
MHERMGTCKLRMVEDYNPHLTLRRSKCLLRSGVRRALRLGLRNPAEEGILGPPRFKRLSSCPRMKGPFGDQSASVERCSVGHLWQKVLLGQVLAGQLSLLNGYPLSHGEMEQADCCPTPRRSYLLSRGAPEYLRMSRLCTPLRCDRHSPMGPRKRVSSRALWGSPRFWVAGGGRSLHGIQRGCAGIMHTHGPCARLITALGRSS